VSFHYRLRPLISSVQVSGSSGSRASIQSATSLTFSRRSAPRARRPRKPWVEQAARRSCATDWRIKDISVVTADGPWRIYRASPKTIEVRLAREERGERIVTREDADLGLDTYRKREQSIDPVFGHTKQNRRFDRSTHEAGWL
jgi:hypothetical protein